MCGSIIWDISQCLRPCCSIGGMRMGNATYFHNAYIILHVFVSEDGRRLPSTVLPSKSTITIFSGVSLHKEHRLV